jgi:hypothetical protein
LWFLSGSVNGTCFAADYGRRRKEFPTNSHLENSERGNEEFLDTTLEDLIVALSEGAAKLVRDGDEKEAAMIVAYVLWGLVSYSEPISKTWH